MKRVNTVSCLPSSGRTPNLNQKKKGNQGKTACPPVAQGWARVEYERMKEKGTNRQVTKVTSRARDITESDSTLPHRQTHPTPRKNPTPNTVPTETRRN